MGDAITGREIVAGLKKGATWGTAVACGALDGILILSESISEKREHLVDDSAGLAFIQRSDIGKIEAAGAIEAYMRYEGFDLPIAQILGAAAAPAQQVATAAYLSVYSLTTDNFGKFCTLALLKKSDIVHEFPSIKFSGFKLAGSMNAPIKLTLDSIADRLVLDSVVNTAATVADVTYPDKGNRIIFNSAAKFRMNAQDGIALADSMKIYPSAFEFSFARKRAADLVAGSAYVAEPDEDGFPDCLLTLEFPRYNDANHAFFTAWQAFTAQKLDIYFEGATIADTYKYYLKIECPNVKLLDPEAAISGPGKMPVKLQFRLDGCDVAPTGMAVTLPFQVSAMNTMTVSPLA